jgi:hypothetical protein
MCALCGLLGTEGDWSTAMTNSLPARQQRYFRIAQANQILSFFRLKLEDFQGVSYVLSSPTGRSEVISDLGQLWPVAETMTGRQIDPLDPALLTWLSTVSQ